MVCHGGVRARLRPRRALAVHAARPHRSGRPRVRDAGEALTVHVSLPVEREGIRIYLPVTDGELGAGVCPPELLGDCLGITRHNWHSLHHAPSLPDGTAELSIDVDTAHSTDTLALQAVVLVQGTAYLSTPQVLNVEDAPQCGTGGPCPCPPGFDGPTCTDIDECSTGTHTCAPPRDACVNTRGGHFCVDDSRTLVYADNDPTLVDQSLRIAAILVNGKGPFPTDRADWSWSPAYPNRLNYYDAADVGQVLFDSPDGTSAFLEEAARGRLSVSGTIVDWTHDYAVERTASELAARREMYFEAAWQFIDPHQYDLFLLVGLADSGLDQRGWTIEGNSVPDGQGGWIEDKGTAFLINSRFETAPRDNRQSGWVLPSAPWPHEILHSMGIIGHSQALWCYPSAAAHDPLATPEQDLVAASSSLSDTCRVSGYGDPFSIMGDRIWATHPSAATKVALGWFDTPEVLHLDGAAQTPETAWLFAQSGEIPGKVRAIQIAVPEFAVEMVDTGTTLHFDRLTLETRAPAGFDQVLHALGQGPRPFNETAYWFLDTTYQWITGFGGVYDLVEPIGTEGVLAYLDHTTESSDAVFLLDARPGAEGVLADVPSPHGHAGVTGKFASAAVQLGETLRSDQLPFEIRVTDRQIDGDGETGLEVEILPRP